MHPSPAAVHYYGGHKNAMAQLDDLPHWFLLEESLFGYRPQGDGCLRIIPPAASGDTQTAEQVDTATSSMPIPLSSAPPGLAPPDHKARLFLEQLGTIKAPHCFSLRNRLLPQRHTGKPSFLFTKDPPLSIQALRSLCMCLAPASFFLRCLFIEHLGLVMILKCTHL